MLLIKGAQNCLYVDNILAKANRSLGFVNRNLYPRSESTRRSYNYCQTELGVCCVELWELGVCFIGPLQARQIDKIEAVQRRGARFFKKDYERTSSVTEMSKSLNLDKLEDRRKVHRLSLFYFAVNNLIALPILIISYSNSISLDLFIIFHLFNQDAVMIIIFIVIFQEQ